MNLVDRARKHTAGPVSAPEAPSTQTVRKVRTVSDPPTGGAYADQLIARVAVDTGAVRIVDGALSIPGIEAVSPVIRQHIDEHMFDVLRIVGEMERAREYGRLYRGERDPA